MYFNFLQQRDDIGLLQQIKHRKTKSKPIEIGNNKDMVKFINSVFDMETMTFEMGFIASLSDSSEDIKSSKFYVVFHIVHIEVGSSEDSEDNEDSTSSAYSSCDSEWQTFS